MRADAWVCPECEQGKHRNCNGWAWDFDADEKTQCECTECPASTLRVVDVFVLAGLWLVMSATGFAANGFPRTAVALLVVGALLAAVAFAQEGVTS